MKNISPQGFISLLHIEGLYVWSGCLALRKANGIKEAEESLKENLVVLEKELNKLIRFDVKQQVYDALVIASFDKFIGIEGVKKSKIIRIVKKGGMKLLEDRILNLNKYSDIEVPLILQKEQEKRRAIEKDILINNRYMEPIARISKPPEKVPLIKKLQTV